jgi:micrococcal nuclease
VIIQGMTYMKKYLIVGALAALIAFPVPANAMNAKYVFKDSRGDTIQYGKTKIRLLDIDTGEIIKGPHGYKCDAELQSGLKARERLFQLISPPNVFTVKYGKGRDLYGRRLAYVYANHKDAGKILMSEGLARPYNPRKGDSKPNHCNAVSHHHHHY